MVSSDEQRSPIRVGVVCAEEDAGAGETEEPAEADESEEARDEEIKLELGTREGAVDALCCFASGFAPVARPSRAHLPGHRLAGSGQLARLLPGSVGC